MIFDHRRCETLSSYMTKRGYGANRELVPLNPNALSGLFLAAKPRAWVTWGCLVHIEHTFLSQLIALDELELYQLPGIHL